MASRTQWTWVWASSRRWWRTGKPGVLQSMGLQRVRHDWVTEQQQLSWNFRCRINNFFRVKVKKSESEVIQSCPTLSDPMDYSPPGPLFVGFSRQEYWSGVPLPSLLTAATCEYIPNIAWDILMPKLHLLFPWISNAVGHPELTLAILHLRLLPAPEKAGHLFFQPILAL